MKKRSLLILVVCAIFLSSRSNPLNNKFSEATLATDVEELKKSGKVDSSDLALLGGWILKAKLSGESLDNKTYSEILNEAKDFKKEQAALAEKAKKEEEEKQAKLGAALTVAMYDKGYEEYDYEDYLKYSVVFENKTEKGIRAVKGAIKITDIFDDEIKTIRLTEDQEIPARKTYKTVYTTDYNQFSDEDKILRSKNMKDIKVVWIPEKIIFADGSTLE